MASLKETVQLTTNSEPWLTRGLPPWPATTRMRCPAGTSNSQSPASVTSDASNSALPCSVMRADSVLDTCNDVHSWCQCTRAESLTMRLFQSAALVST